MQIKLDVKLAIYGALFLYLIFPYVDKLATEQWMRYQLRNETIVVALSTTPHRIKQIGSTLESLFSQNMHVQNIYLSIPYIFKRENIEYTIPAWLSNDKRVTILRGDDYGPATKLLGVLAQTNLPADAIIITVDDDIKYPKNLVLQLAYKAKTKPNQAIGLRGSDIEYDSAQQVSEHSSEGFINNTTPDANVSFLQGYAGIAYKRRFFGKDIFAIKNAPSACINSDDLYLSFYIAKHNIKRQVLINKYLSVDDLSWDELAVGKDALHKQTPGPAEKHRACVAYMKAQNPQVIF